MANKFNAHAGDKSYRRPVGPGVSDDPPLLLQVVRGSHFAGNCNPFPQNSGLDCRKSALGGSIITTFPGGACPGPLAAEHP